MLAWFFARLYLAHARARAPMLAAVAVAALPISCVKSDALARVEINNIGSVHVRVCAQSRFHPNICALLYNGFCCMMSSRHVGACVRY